MTILIYLNSFICVSIAAILFLALRDALHEKEKRAAKLYLISSASWIMFSTALFYSIVLVPGFGYILPAVSVLSLVLFAAFPPKRSNDYSYSEHLVDERDIMFSRAELKPGTKRFKAYYANKPDKLIADNKFRTYPGLLSKAASFYDEQLFQKAEQNFVDVKTLHPLVNMPATNTPSNDIPDNPYAFLKKMALEYGAHSVGSTQTQNHHWYSVKGRGDEYGLPVTDKLPYALAFTIEMDFFNVQRAPMAEIVMESSQQYLNSGKIAIAIAEKLRSWGYEARAHIDGNYQLICPIVARDAGLGEIGRMGLLMTPKLGPRVRIAVITTNMELPVKNVKTNFSVLRFCEKCKICSDACPSHAIPATPRRDIHGSHRWQIDQEKCFTLWSQFGTDCGVCMKKCPFSHPNTLSHNLVRFGIQHSEAFQTLALWMEKRIY